MKKKKDPICFEITTKGTVRLTLSSHEFIKELLPGARLWVHFGHLVEIIVRNSHVFGITCHIDHLKGQIEGWICFCNLIVFNYCLHYQVAYLFFTVSEHDIYAIMPDLQHSQLYIVLICRSSSPIFDKSAFSLIFHKIIS